MRKYLGLLLSSFLLLGAEAVWTAPGAKAGASASKAAAIRQYRGQALTLAMNNDADAALNYYAQALDLAKQEFGATSPYVGEIYFDMGVVAFESDKFAHAENLFKEAIKLNPNSMAARLKLGELANKRAHYDEAARQARYVLSRQKDNLAGRQVLAEAYAQDDNSVKSMQEYFYMDALAHGYGNIAPAVPSPAMPGALPPPQTAIPEPAKPDKPSTVAVPPASAAAKPASKPTKAEKKAPEKPAAPKALTKVEKKSEKKELKKPVEKSKKKDEKKPTKEKKGPALSKPAQLAGSAVSIVGGAAKLTTTPVLLTPINKKAKIEPTEETGAKTECKIPEKKQPAPAKAKVTQEECPVPKPAKKSPRGFVPPPPPVMPSVFPVAPPPPVQPPPRPVKIEKQKEKVPEIKDEKPESNEDPDFLLDWGGKGKKK